MSLRLKASRKIQNPMESGKVDEFRRQWIDNVDKKFFQFSVNSDSEDSPELDDIEVSRLQREFERLQRKWDQSDKEWRRNELFQFLPLNTCSSDQVLYVRNERLATSFNDIDVLFLRDSDPDNFTMSDASASLSHFHYSTSTSESLQSRRSRHNLIRKIRRFFTCW